MKEYFKKFTSNTYAGSGNQLYFRMEKGEVRTGRVFYQISVAGAYHYSLLFSNVIDSTYSDGSVSRHDLICGGWTILGARIGKCRQMGRGNAITSMVLPLDEDAQSEPFISAWKPMTFDGQPTKHVQPGEFFASDPLPLEYKKGEYLCLEMTFSGEMIPYHEESLLPVFVKGPDGWKYSREMPFAGMIGCDRQVKARIGYLGDSITQGIGTELNSYEHWNARLSEKLGEEYAFWNLGIGYGRASDAAADGAWLFKARQNDVVFVCYGVNDMLQGRTEAQVKEDLTRIVDALQGAGIKVILQTVPPFNYAKEIVEMWERINQYIKTVLCPKAYAVFDNVPVLCESMEHASVAKFGGHPNAEGCAAWANALYEQLGRCLL